MSQTPGEEQGRAASAVPTGKKTGWGWVEERKGPACGIRSLKKLEGMERGRAVKGGLFERAGVNTHLYAGEITVKERGDWRRGHCWTALGEEDSEGGGRGRFWGANDFGQGWEAVDHWA